MCAPFAIQDGPVSTPPPESETSSLASDSNPLVAVMPRMIALMRAGIEILEPNASFTSGMQRKTVFAGSYDWHSCVIAHWALLVHARQQDDVELGSWVRARIELAALTHESETLQLRPDKFALTGPYDEAWFLMLLSELGRHPANHKNDHVGFLALREFHEKRLLKALEERPFPEYRKENEEGKTLYVGSYKSWLWTYLLLRWSDPISEGCIQRLDGLRNERLLPAGQELATKADPFRPHPYDFLWIPALFALESGDSDYDPGELDSWPKQVTIRDVHILGRELSRLWPTMGQRQTAARLAHFLAREDLWAGDFAVVSHWIPQYLFLANWFAQDRP